MMKLRFAGIGIFLSTLLACGGGGGGGGGGEPSRPDVFYVRASIGNDANDGTTPATAFQTIGAAISRLTDGDTIIVGPGTYNETIRLDAPGAGTAEQPIVFLADPTGLMTSNAPGPVVVNGQENGPVIRLTGFPYTTIDGFVIRGGAGSNTAGILIRTDSNNVVVQNCIVRDNVDNAGGIRVQDSNDVLLFNNLIHDNSGIGIAVLGNISGSQRTRIINNTVARNNRGLSIGTSQTASADTFILNNIIFANEDRGGTNRNIVVSQGPPSSLDGYEAQLNLVFPRVGSYSPGNLPHPTDINDDPLFVDPDEDNFRISQTSSGQADNSPALDAGSIDGVPGSPVDFNSLFLRTTASDAQTDTFPLDLGFHDILESAGAGLTFYVRASAGSNSNDGRSPNEAFQSIGRAVQQASAGDVIVVGPGQYDEAIIDPPTGSADRLLTFLGDPTGRLTGDIAGPVTVDAGGEPAAFSLAGAEFVIVDGFTVTGGDMAGIEVRSNSSNVTIRHCESLDNQENGILVRDSSSVLVFDNLVTGNGGNGITVGGTSGSRNVQVVNNTVANNNDRGIRVGEGSAASTNVDLQNNIIQDNGGAGVQANAPSAETLELSFNLVFPENYIPQEIQGPNDINENAEFVGSDYYLTQSTSPAVDAGDTATDEALTSALHLRTTDPAGARDMGRIDLGYHFPVN
jgi:hypothetical protein